MKEFNFSCPRVDIRELKIIASERSSISVTLELYDINGNFVGSVILDSKNAKHCSFHVNEDMATTIHNLFNLIENQISDKKTISFADR